MLIVKVACKVSARTDNKSLEARFKAIKFAQEGAADEGWFLAQFTKFLESVAFKYEL